MVTLSIKEGAGNKKSLEKKVSAIDKTFGNIVCFRDLKKATDDAIALFGDKEAGGIVLLKPMTNTITAMRKMENQKLVTPS
jgi:type I site-specific restriction-modification system R (restriction) subunit